ncbi:GNAT family N-acetyltransferase [Bdellovibrio sp. HCB337]|uniref:GNAT family N-acetyltransferase n=1 Tax=Bdellovibrio sp. HCB337 TaxID=3394358 RepID=UPI0039A6146C
MEKTQPPAKMILANHLLKRRSLADVYTAFECIDSDRVRLREFLPWVDATKSVDDQRWYVNECIKDWEAGTLFDYGIFTPDDEYVGSLGIHNIRWEHDTCELGYWLHSKQEGKGCISSGVAAVEKILFEMGFNRIEIRCDPHNKKSGAVPQRNGFTFEGTLRQNMLFRGQYRDTAVYAKIKADLKR